MKYTANGVDIILEYIEPTTNEDGSALDDLHHTSVYYELDGVVVNVIDLPAVLLTGGGAKSYGFSVPVVAGQVKLVSIWATATDESGNTSAPSKAQMIRIDRLAPAPPF